MSRELYQRIGRVIGENPASDPEETAVREVAEGILSPLDEFGDSLGLSPEEIAAIQKYAQVASVEMRKRVEEERAQNPLMQIDILFAKDFALMEYDKNTSSDVIFRLQLARESLRKTQEIIKTTVFDEIQLAQKEGREISIKGAVERICDREKDNEGIGMPIGVSGYFYTKLSEGRDFEDIMSKICGEDLVQKIKQETRSFGDSERKSMHDIPTVIDGTKGEIPHWSLQYRSAYLHFGVVFTREAVLRIAKSLDLPPLVKEK